MRQIILIIALMLTIACSNKIDLKETQKWLKKHGKTYSINELKNLKKLYLGRTQVSDLTPLKGLHNLESLNLKGTNVSDLTPLKGLQNLKWLYLKKTKVSKKDILELKKALPKCRIIYSALQLAE